MTNRAQALLPVLGLATGCCLDVGGVAFTSSSAGPVPDATTTGPRATTGGRSTGSSSTGGSSAGASSTGGSSTSASSTGSSSTGARPLLIDAGTCLIGGNLYEAGDWKSARFGSCTVCDPDKNPTKWTALPEGAPCEILLNIYSHYPPDSGLVPIIATCQTDILPPYSVCAGFPAGSPCGGDAGPGSMQFKNGQKGWCCELPDGGVPPCAAAGMVCDEDSQCCGGLSCLSRGVYGTCE